MDIANGGDVLQIVLSGTPSAFEISEQWESIVSQNNRENGSNLYDTYFENFQEYYRLCNEYVMIRAILLRCNIATTVEEIKKHVDYVNIRGYRLNIKEGIDSHKFIESLDRAFSKCDNLKTRIQMKLNEIKASNVEGNNDSFDDVMANLVSLLQTNVDDDITLSRYNSFQKVLKRRVKGGKEHAGTE